MDKIQDFDACYRENAQRMYGVAFRMVQNHFDALDIVQEGFLRAYKSWDKFKGNSKISTWLYRIITNLSYDFLRKKNREKKMEFFENCGMKSFTFSGENRIIQQNILAKVKEEIETLTPKQKMVFILKTYEDLSYKEIAKITHSRIGTVKATYFQTIQKLRKNLVKKKGVMKTWNAKICTN